MEGENPKESKQEIDEENEDLAKSSNQAYVTPPVEQSPSSKSPSGKASIEKPGGGSLEGDSPKFPKSTEGVDQPNSIEIIEQPKSVEVIEQPPRPKSIEIIEQPPRPKSIEIIEQPPRPKSVEIIDPPIILKSGEVVETSPKFKTSESIEQPFLPKFSEIAGLKQSKQSDVFDFEEPERQENVKSETTYMSSPKASSPKERAGTRTSTVIPPTNATTRCFPLEFLNKRSPFIHEPPQPEERRARIVCPRTPREYIINLREDLADFQESHGLPRTRDYSFLSLGLALAQETVRALYSLFLMFAELFPILAIVSLILRFALDKLIEILETNEPVVKVKKAVIFGLEMLVIVIPLWILIGTIIIPLLSLVLSVFKKFLQFKGGKRRPCVTKAKPKIVTDPPC